MPTKAFTATGNIGGVAISGSSLSRTGETQLGHELDTPLPAASSGTLTTRTSDTAGAVTLSAGHGMAISDTIAIFWTDDAGVVKCAYGATVSGVSTAHVITFTGATGDALPAEDSTVTVDEVTTISDCGFDGDNAELLVASMTRKGTMVFKDSDSAVLHDLTFQAAEWALLYASNHNMTNPLTGNPVDTIDVYNGDGSNTNTPRIVGVIDSV